MTDQTYDLSHAERRRVRAALQSICTLRGFLSLQLVSIAFNGTNKGTVYVRYNRRRNHKITAHYRMKRNGNRMTVYFMGRQITTLFKLRDGYRFSGQNGSTRHSEREVERHLFKIGTPEKVTLYTYRPRYGITPRVSVKGTKGTAIFGGYAWGYHGQGSRGLVELLVRLGAPRSKAESVVFDMNSNYDEVRGKGRDIKASFEKGVFTVAS